MQKIIIIGATSGIGRALALVYLKKGFTVGITGRRLELLNEIAAQYPESCFVSCFDVTQEDAETQLLHLAHRMGLIDRIIVNAGIGNNSPKVSKDLDLRTVQINVVGFVRMATVAYQLFQKQGFGHLVGVSSIASYFGYGRTAAYNASKAFVATYLSGLVQRAKKAGTKIKITDIQPGFVLTPLIEGKKEVFGAITAERFAEIIIPKLDDEPRRIIAPFRWKWAVLLLKIVPDSLIQRFP